mmetsp:Transcript_19656/g.62513  ORF Transcript_19656/g.62513 Transcript_19656/m.62513 type:complete len:415 (-) Transcript_19656:2050-3294(-)
MRTWHLGFVERFSSPRSTNSRMHSLSGRRLASVTSCSTAPSRSNSTLLCAPTASHAMPRTPGSSSASSPLRHIVIIALMKSVSSPPRTSLLVASSRNRPAALTRSSSLWLVSPQMVTRTVWRSIPISASSNAPFHNERLCRKYVQIVLSLSRRAATPRRFCATIAATMPTAPYCSIHTCTRSSALEWDAEICRFSPRPPKLLLEPIPPLPLGRRDSLPLPATISSSASSSALNPTPESLDMMSNTVLTVRKPDFILILREGSFFITATGSPLGLGSSSDTDAKLGARPIPPNSRLLVADKGRGLGRSPLGKPPFPPMVLITSSDSLRPSSVWGPGGGWDSSGQNRARLSLSRTRIQRADITHSILTISLLVGSMMVASLISRNPMLRRLSTPPFSPMHFLLSSALPRHHSPHAR